MYVKPLIQTAIVTLFVGVVSLASAQNSRETVQLLSESRPDPPASAVQDNIKVKKKYSYDVYYDRLIEEYSERMRANVVKYRKLARKLRKPQYSDPSYFGHKHKPKKRPVGKRKLCRECLIVH